MATNAFRNVLPSRPEARKMIFGTLLGAIGQGMTLPFLFIYLHEVRHLSSTLVGLVVGWMGLLSLILAGPAGSLIDRLGARRVMLPLYVVNAVGVGMYALVHSPWQAFAAATLASLGGAVLWGGQNTLMATITTEEERQHVFGLAFAVLNLGIGLGGLIAGFIADKHHIRSFELIYSINAVASLLPGVILLSLRSIGKPVGTREERAAAAVGGYREVFASKAFRRFITFLLLIMVSGYAQIEIGYPAFASLVGGVGTRVIALGLTANTLTIVVAQLFVLRWMRGRSRSRGLVVVGVVIASAWVILGVSAWAKSLGAAVPIVGVVLCASVFAFGETLMTPVLPAITNAIATDELRGRYNAMGSMVYGVTSIVGPLTAAPLIGHHLGQVWIILIVLGSLGASVVAFSLRGLLTPEQDGRVLLAGESEPGPLEEPILGALAQVAVDGEMRS